MIRDTFRGVLSKKVSLDSIRAHAVRGGAGESACDSNLWRELAELGMSGLIIAAENGGSGLSMLDAALVGQELGRAAAPVPFVGACVAAPLIVQHFATSTHRDEWLPLMASGDMRCGAGLSFEGAVRKDENGLTGTARFVLDAGGATHFLIPVGADFHLIKADAKGLSVVLEPAFDPLQGLGRVELSHADSIALTGGNAADAERIVEAGRIALAAQTMGACEFLIEAAVNYAGERRQFGRLIGSFQAVKHMCADMAAALYPAIAMCWYAAYVFDHDPEKLPLNARMAKSLADEAGRQIARTAIEVHGGMGYTDLVGLHYWYKRAAFNRTMLGNPEELRQQIAELQGI